MQDKTNAATRERWQKNQQGATAAANANPQNRWNQHHGGPTQHSLNGGRWTQDHEYHHSSSARSSSHSPTRQSGVHTEREEMRPPQDHVDISYYSEEMHFGGTRASSRSDSDTVIWDSSNPEYNESRTWGCSHPPPPASFNPQANNQYSDAYPESVGEGLSKDVRFADNLD